MQKLFISLGVLVFSASVGAQDIGLKMAPVLKQPQLQKSRPQPELRSLSVEGMPKHAAREALVVGGQPAETASSRSDSRWVVLPWVVRTSDGQRDVPRVPSEVSKSIGILGAFQGDIL